MLVYFVKRYVFCTSPFVLNHFEQRNGKWIASSDTDLRSSGMLRGVDWQLVVDVSVKPIGPSSVGQVIQLGLLGGLGVFKRSLSCHVRDNGFSYK